MSSIDYIKFQVSKVIRRAIKPFGLTYIYMSNKGVKTINLRLKSIKKYQSNENLFKPIETADLCLFVDGLRDDFTLIGTPISHSPHFELMKALLNSDSFDKTTYKILAEKGELDSRDCTFYSSRFYSATFRKNMHRNDPILVLQKNETKYLLDGKHRAVLAHLRKEKINAIVLTEIENEKNLLRMYKLMLKKDPNNFSKHIKLFNSLFNSNA